MIRTNEFEFNRNGQITLFASVNLQRVIKLCTLHARRKKIRKPYAMRLVPTLNNEVQHG